MRWDQTIAAQCRYGNIAERIFGEADIIWEHSEENWQGHVNVLARFTDGTFGHYEYTYGSCAGCDEWEDRGLSHDEIEQIMRHEMVTFPADGVILRRYLKLDTPHGGDPAPSGWRSQDGLEYMAQAFKRWSDHQRGFELYHGPDCALCAAELQGR